MQKRFFLLLTAGFLNLLSAHECEWNSKPFIRASSWTNPSCWSFQKELLFWTTYEDGLEYRNKNSDILTTTDFTKTRLIHSSFHWEYGFRLKGCYMPPCSPWTLSLSWLYLASKATGFKKENSDSPNYQGFYPIWSMSTDTLKGDYVSNSKMRWYLHTNLIDFDAQCRVYCRNRISITSVIGLRCAILNQKLRVKYSGGAFFNGEDNNSMQNRFLGIGPRFGVGTSYALFRGLSMIGTIAVDPLVSHFRTYHHERYLEQERFRKSRSLNRLTWVFDYQIGFEWKGIICQGWPRMVISLFWEGHRFFNQNRMYRGKENFFDHDHDLTMQGWTVSASLRL